jgi:hypothetical protein
MKIEELIGSERRYTGNGKRAYLLDRTRHRARAWIVIEGESTGFDRGVHYLASRKSAETHIKEYLA